MAGFVVAVTGGVASGKSAVTSLFECLGVVVVDADVVAREVVAHGQPALAEIASRFGSSMLLPDGSLDRVAMRARVFEDASARRDIEAITHPRIRALLQSGCESASGPYAIVAIALLAESGAVSAYPWLGRILVVDVPVALQRTRLVSRDKVDEALALRMIEAQANRAQRLAIAADVVTNDGHPHDLVGPVNRLDALYRRLA